jgi:zinc and cadmium transporter
MTASPHILLLIYCVAIAAFSLVGGYLPSRIRMTHTRTQLIMSLVSGLMLGVAFYHLLPHSIAMKGDQAAVDFSVWWLMLGLIAMLLLLRLFHFHEHDFSEEHGEGHDHHHAHAHAHAHAHGQGHDDGDGAHSLSWLGLGLGLGLHTLIDGIALGAIMRVDGHVGHVEGLIGIGVFLAILLHKPLDAMSIVTVMQAGGWSKRARQGANLLFALMCPLGALLFYFGVELLGNAAAVISASLAFSAGAFICIALSDLLPEVHFHSHDRAKLTLSFLLGIAMAYAIGSVEPAGIHVAG